MKLLIAGSRNFTDYDYLKNKIYDLQNNYDISTVISGKANGADALGERFAFEHSIKIEEYPAEWDLYGKRAGMIRNELMGKVADMTLFFWDGKSKGTKHMIKYMKSLRKPVIVELYHETDLDEW